MGVIFFFSRNYYSSLFNPPFDRRVSSWRIKFQRIEYLYQFYISLRFMLQKEKEKRKKEEKKLSCASNLYKFEKSNNSCARVSSSLYFNLHSLQCSFPNCNSARKLVVLIQNFPSLPSSCTRALILDKFFESSFRRKNILYIILSLLIKFSLFKKNIYFVYIILRLFY